MKTLFLQKVKQEMELGAMNVVCARIESLDPRPDAETGGVTSRATLHLGPTLRESARWLSAGGSAFLWKGERRDQELRDDPDWENDWELSETMNLPDTPTVVVRFVRK
jgi:16S rRNA G527 N7-methylase RsmG